MWASREHRKTQSYNRANFASLINSRCILQVCFFFFFFLAVFYPTALECVLALVRTKYKILKSLSSSYVWLSKVM